MIKFLNDIRNAEKPISNNRKIINTIAVLQAVEKPGCAIRRQPGFQHIFGKIESKIGNGQSHSISTLPFF